MTINDQIRDQKLQYDINRKVAKISSLSSGKIDKYEYFTGKEILTSDEQQIREKAKFSYSPLGKTFEKQNKSNWKSRRETSWGFKIFKTKTKLLIGY